MKILVIKTSSMGDLVHCLPAVTDIAKAYPQACIDWLAEESFADIAALHPSVHSVHTCALRRWRRSLLASTTRQEIGNLRQTISAEKYDYIIDFQGLIKSSLWVKGSKARQIHGYDWRSARESAASLLYRYKHSVDVHIHAISRNRMLAASVFDYVLSNAAESGLMQRKDRQEQVVFLHGTSRQSKAAPVAMWKKLAQRAHHQGLQVLLPWHCAQEHEQAQDIAGADAWVLEKMSIAEITPILAQSKLVIAVDTGLAHLAAALGTPTLALFYNSNPALTGVVGRHGLNLVGQTPDGMQTSPARIEVMDMTDASTIYDKAKTLLAL